MIDMAIGKSWKAYWSTIKVAHLIMIRTLTGGALIYTFLEPTFWIASTYVLYTISTEYSNILKIFPRSADYLIFTLLGLAVFSYTLHGIVQLGFLFYREQTRGTLESIFTTPTNPLLWIWGRMTYSLIFTTLNFIYVILIGFIFLGLKLPGTNVTIFVIAALTFTIISTYGLGLILGGLCLLYRNPFVVTNVTVTVMFLIAGVIVPIEILPEWIQILSTLLPLTYGLKLVRESISMNALPDTTIKDFGILVTVSITLCLIGLLLFKHLHNMAKKKGVIGQY